jgi:hypothetical protein
MCPLVQHHVFSLTVHLRDLKYSWQWKLPRMHKCTHKKVQKKPSAKYLLIIQKFSKIFVSSLCLLNKCTCVSNVWHFSDHWPVITKGQHTAQKFWHHKLIFKYGFWKMEQHGKYSFSSVWKISYSILMYAFMSLLKMKIWFLTP